MSNALAEIIDRLADIPSSVDLFNQYVDATAADLRDAAAIRKRNLYRYLTSFETGPEILVLAEAPGPWGCRYTGIPITSEEQLKDDSFPVRGQTSTSGPATPEYSARIFWRVMRPFYNRFLVWNAVPFHPHHADNIDSIRTPRTSELKQFAPLTEQILAYFNPKTILALGRRPEKQLAYLNVDATYVRHPSQGGAKQFEESMLEIFQS